MNIERSAQVSPYLSAQRTAAQLDIAVAKLTNKNIEAQGQAALQLIQSIPQPQGNIGNNINVSV